MSDNVICDGYGGGDEHLHRISAKDIMARFAITVNEDSYLLSVAHLMMRFRISGLPVLSRSGEIVGIITATDLFRSIGEYISKGNASDFFVKTSKEKVKDVMTREVHHVTPDTSFMELIKIMHNKNIHTLPVIDKGEIVGIIGRRDVINTFFNPSSGTA
ncbi:MAG TPA: CBS domain-containing protein [Candidatus Omnitrophota bacterium]|nr:CBS domain-containing protein [Candidatus Omnitrophota bacterium]HPS20631.1 CBS domain-containing protein [Candidatus Omnitrophota bacterium]